MTDSWVVGNEGCDVELRRRQTLGLLEIMEATLNCEDNDLLVIGNEEDLAEL